MSQGQLNDTTQLLNAEGTNKVASDKLMPSTELAKEDSDLTSLFQTMTQAEMADYRELVADKALICAVKTIQEINRA